MSLRSILVVTDLSPQEGIALQRAWQLAEAHRATVKLMLVPARGQPLPRAAASRLANTARQLEESLGLRVTTVPVQEKAHRLEDIAAEARGMDLVVLPHRHERSTAAFFRGQPVLRLLRHCNCPVLVARAARGSHYRRILVTVDFTPLSQALVKLAAKVDAHAALEIFHAISTLDESKLRSAEATEQAVRSWRTKTLRHARERVVALSDSFDVRRNRVATVIGRGDPGRQAVIQQEHTGADLVVVGKQPASAWEDFFCGSVAHRILSWGTSDVLVVPETWAQASAPVAARRMRQAGRGPALEWQPARGRLS
ncbi:MAG TPA: universal stress protein [Ramlibacter sp.]|uniref:universal stress protein n=1 Tax=Ramlibacter sp. TaxID=1917967 RepID=UPI002D7F8FBE|nr:universal stress protein [Ramlibacter sp.]HET8746740.1 universal stress protein [Ramlibacter sp.]